MKRKLRIAIYGWNSQASMLRHHYLFALLRQKYDVELSITPDLVFFSRGIDHRLLPRCHRVFFTSENVKPDFNVCDYAFSFEDTDERNFLFPNFARFFYFRWLNPQEPHDFWESDDNPGQVSADELEEFNRVDKSRFCCFIYLNESPQERIEFCKKLMSYKKVDCPGEVLNNMPSFDECRRGRQGGPIRSRFNFQARYKFSIAFENISSINYITEKICIPLACGSIPIYWGSPRVSEYFNPEAFINCHDYDNFDQVIKRVIEVDNDDNLYQKYVNAPAIVKGSKLPMITEEKIMERLDKIVDSIGTVTPVSRRLSYKLRLPLYKLDRLQFIARSKLQLGKRLKKLISS